MAVYDKSFMKDHPSGRYVRSNGANGLLQRILDICTGGSGPGADWTVILNQSPIRDDADHDISGAEWSSLRQVVLKNTGFSGNDAIYIGMREYSYSTGAMYGIELNVYNGEPSSFFSNLSNIDMDDYDDTYNTWDDLPRIPMPANTQDMEYWIISDKERIFACVEHSGNYYQFYLGNFLRFGDPGEYPYPCIAAGCNSFTAKSAITDDDWYGPVKPQPDSESFIVIDPSSNYRTYKNDSTIVVPAQKESHTLSRIVELVPGTSEGVFIPAYILESNQTLGQYKGLHCVLMPSVGSKTVYTSNGQKLIAFQQGHKSDLSNYLAQEIPTTTTTTTHTTTSTTTTTV